MAYSFLGGIHPPDSKAFTNKKSIELARAPKQVTIPVSMHIGAPSIPIVNIGDVVDMGQMIAQPGSDFSTAQHASISGKVIDISPKLHPNGMEVLSIVIENDFEDRLHTSIAPLDFENLTNDERILAIKNAGIVGHGGATFPTHIKINSGLGKVDTVLINGAECEPYITSDHRIMLEYPNEIIGGIKFIQKIFGDVNAIIGIELNKSDTFPGINTLIGDDSTVKIAPLKCKYPQGAEKQLIYATTSREVPSGGLPADAGCAVFNVDTVAAIYRLFTKGMPVMRRIVTISGSAIANPRNLDVRIGTNIAELIEYCGGFKNPPNKLIMGGPMMGVSQFTLDIPIIKATNAFLSFCKKEDIRAKDPSCIRCGKCVSACPMNLMPLYMNLYAKANDLYECDKLGVLDCIECGACSYECPARIQLTQTFKATKTRVLQNRKILEGIK